MTPVEALERVVHCLDRAHETGFKTKAFVRALEVVRGHTAGGAARAGRRRHADRARGHRRLDGAVDHRGAATATPATSTRSRPRRRSKLTDDGARYRVGAEGRLPPAQPVERRRSDDRSDGANRARSRPRVHGADRSLAAPHHRPRAEQGAAGAATRRCRGAQREDGAVPDPHRHRGRHPRGRLARPRRRRARRNSTSSWPACTPSCGWSASR